MSFVFAKSKGNDLFLTAWGYQLCGPGITTRASVFVLVVILTAEVCSGAGGTAVRLDNSGGGVSQFWAPIPSGP